MVRIWVGIKDNHKRNSLLCFFKRLKEELLVSRMTLDIKTMLIILLITFQIYLSY